MNDPRIATTANPTGTTVKHQKPFNPTRKAVFINGMWVHQFENLARNGGIGYQDLSFEEQGKKIVNMPKRGR